MKRYMSFIVVLFALVFVGCDANDGAMEKAGEKVDETTTDIGNAVEDLCEDAKDKLNSKNSDC